MFRGIRGTTPAAAEAEAATRARRIPVLEREINDRSNLLFNRYERGMFGDEDLDAARSDLINYGITPSRDVETLIRQLSTKDALVNSVTSNIDALPRSERAIALEDALGTYLNYAPGVIREVISGQRNGATGPWGTLPMAPAGAPPAVPGAPGSAAPTPAPTSMFGVPLRPSPAPAPAPMQTTPAPLFGTPPTPAPARSSGIARRPAPAPIPVPAPFGVPLRPSPAPAPAPSFGIARRPSPAPESSSLPTIPEEARRRPDVKSRMDRPAYPGGSEIPYAPPTYGGTGFSPAQQPGGNIDRIANTRITSGVPEGLQGQREALLSNLFHQADINPSEYPSERLIPGKARLENLASNEAENLHKAFGESYKRADALSNEAAQDYADNYRRYENPYIEQVIDNMERRANRNIDESERRLMTRAAAMGKNPSRSSSTTRAIAKAINEQMENMHDTSFRFLSDQYNKNADIYHSDKARALEAGRNIGQTAQARTQGRMAKMGALAEFGGLDRDIQYQKNLHDFNEIRRRENLKYERQGAVANLHNQLPFATRETVYSPNQAPALRHRNYYNMAAGLLFGASPYQQPNQQQQQPMWR
jgi:hypothetical protein